MPCKIHLSGHTTFYNLSNYQKSAKEHLKSNNRRFYKIKSTHRKNIISSAKYIQLIKKPTDTAVFFTLTFPSPINTETGEINLSGQYNPYYNDQISSFLDYWKNKGINKTNLKGYIWTKELTNSLQIHYHVIGLINSKIPKGIVKKLNKVWGNYTKFNSENGFRVGKKGIILHTIEQSVKYASKYASKSQKGIECFPSPAYRISNSLKIEPKIFHERINDKEITEIDNNFNRLYLSDWAEIGMTNEKISEKYFDI